MGANGTVFPGSFHAGQLYAFDGLYELAIHRFKKSFNPNEEKQSELSWNTYVKATIAFLNKNKAELKSAREEMNLKNETPGNQLNEGVVNRLLHCTDRSYKDAYTRICE
jgi:hypothetical protein